MTFGVLFRTWITAERTADRESGQLVSLNPGGECPPQTSVRAISQNKKPRSLSE